MVALVVVGLGVPFAASARVGATTVSNAAGSVACGRLVATRFVWMKGFNDPATPDALDKVGVLEVGPASARNVLVLNPGTSAGSGYFKPLADDIVRRTHGGWQVWSVERRENQLEDQFVLDQYKGGLATTQQLFDYYLGWLTDPTITNHFQLIPDSSVPFAKGWGLNVEIQDLHRVVEAAKQAGRTVVMGGHSLGGSITTAYATWDFHGHAGADDLAGLVYIDGGSGPTPVTAAQAQQSLQSLKTGTPWLAFGGIGAPFLGLFSALGSTDGRDRPEQPVAGGELRVPARQPETARARDERSAVRVRRRHQDVAAEPAGGAGARGPAREWRSPRVVARRRDHARFGATPRCCRARG